MKSCTLNTLLNFGKRKGYTVEHILKKDSTYLSWSIWNL
ncbi:exodeoxyribonuclease X C-terminal domain-containing protein [Algibacter mikhailovii]